MHKHASKELTQIVANDCHTTRQAHCCNKKRVGPARMLALARALGITGVGVAAHIQFERNTATTRRQPPSAGHAGQSNILVRQGAAQCGQEGRHALRA